MKTPALIKVFVLSVKFNWAVHKNDIAKAEQIQAEAKQVFFPKK